MFAAGRFVAVIFPLFLIPCSVALADTPPAHDLLAVTEDWPPYDYQGPNGEVIGISSEIVHATLAQAGMQSTFKVYPWARTLFLAKNRPNTLIFSLSRSKEREDQFIWIGELMPRDDRFYRAMGRKHISPTSISEVKSCCTICVVNKDIVDDDLKREGFVEHKQFITADSFDDCMKMVQTGAVPLLVDSPMNLAWELKSHNDVHTSFESVMSFTPSEQEPLYLAASRGTDPAIVSRLKNAFATLQQNGQINQIIQQFQERMRNQ
jgi:polar amino acid transport system substrate-binding protein